jgi:predicted tellurium resistance membrane protein TerC
VLAVAAAAQGNMPLLVLGLLVSVPLIVFGASMLTKVMERFPIIITIGAALLGFLAGEMLLTDPAVGQYIGAVSETTVKAAGLAGAVLVVALGNWLQRRGNA